MDAIDEMDEDQLIDYAIELSLRDSCKQIQFTSIERYVIKIRTQL